MHITPAGKGQNHVPGRRKGQPVAVRPGQYRHRTHCPFPRHHGLPGEMLKAPSDQPLGICPAIARSQHDGDDLHRTSSSCCDQALSRSRRGTRLYTPKEDVRPEEPVRIAQRHGPSRDGTDHGLAKGDDMSQSGHAQDVGGQKRKIMGSHHVSLRGEAVGVAERRPDHSQHGCPAVHQCRKAGDVTADMLRNGDRGVIARGKGQGDHQIPQSPLLPRSEPG